MASTLSLRMSMWWNIFSRFVPLGGAISLVITNLPEFNASLNRDTIVFTPLLNSHRPRLKGDMVIAGRLILTYQVEPVLLLQSVVDKCPGAVFFFIHLTFAVVGATTGAVDQPFVAGSNRADTGGFAKQAL